MLTDGKISNCFFLDVSVRFSIYSPLRSYFQNIRFKFKVVRSKLNWRFIHLSFGSYDGDNFAQTMALCTFQFKDDPLHMKL